MCIIHKQRNVHGAQKSCHALPDGVTSLHRQYPLHSELKQCGKRGEDAIQKELNQQHMFNTFY